MPAIFEPPADAVAADETDPAALLDAGDIPPGNPEETMVPPEADTPDPAAVAPPPADLLAMQLSRAAIFGEAVRNSRGARQVFSDEFAKLSAMQLVARRIAERNIPPNDPICVLIEVLGLFDFRQRELIIAHGALLGHNEDAYKALLGVIEVYMLQAQDHRASLDRSNLRLDSTNKRLTDTGHRNDELGLFLREFVLAAKPLADRLEVAADILDTKSHRAVLLNWLIPCIVIFLAIVLDRLLISFHLW